MRDSFIFYRSFFEAIKELSPEDQASVYNAIFQYSLNGFEVELSGIQKSIFTLIKPQLDANNKRFLNGQNGGRPKKVNQKKTKTKPNNNQNETKTEPNNNVNDNVNDNVNENDNITFDIFWGKYRKKTGKANSIKEWDKLKVDERKMAIERLEPYLCSCEEKYTLDPERYLKYKRFLDFEPVKILAKSDFKEYGEWLAYCIKNNLNPQEA
jgi:hypothetical protein